LFSPWPGDRPSARQRKNSQADSFSAVSRDTSRATLRARRPTPRRKRYRGRCRFHHPILGMPRPPQPRALLAAHLAAPSGSGIFVPAKSFAFCIESAYRALPLGPQDGIQDWDSQQEAKRNGDDERGRFPPVNEIQGRVDARRSPKFIGRDRGRNAPDRRGPPASQHG
jgi:hypothetical protein